MVGYFLDLNPFTMAKKPTSKTVHISAKTGQYVTAGYANSHPATTVKMTVKAGKKGK